MRTVSVIHITSEMIVKRLSVFLILVLSVCLLLHSSQAMNRAVMMRMMIFDVIAFEYLGHKFNDEGWLGGKPRDHTSVRKVFTNDSTHGVLQCAI